MYKGLFVKKDKAFFTTKDVDFILFNNNIKETESQDLDVFLFGSVIIVHNGKELETKTCTLATRVIMEIYSDEQVVKEDEKHTIIKFKAGDKVIKHDAVIQSLANVNELFEAIMGGNVSPLVAYYDYYEIIMNCMKFNKMVNTPKLLLEIMVSELFLDTATGTKPARLSSDPNEKGIPASINDLIQTKNTFNSMTFEDASKSILINKGKTDAQQKVAPSPLETYMRK